jgi:hypothetical protein
LETEIHYVVFSIDSAVRNYAKECPGSAAARSNGELLGEPWGRKVCTDLPRRV